MPSIVSAALIAFAIAQGTQIQQYSLASSIEQQSYSEQTTVYSSAAFARCMPCELILLNNEESETLNHTALKEPEQARWRGNNKKKQRKRKISPILNVALSSNQLLAHYGQTALHRLSDIKPKAKFQPYQIEQHVPSTIEIMQTKIFQYLAKFNPFPPQHICSHKPIA